MSNAATMTSLLTRLQANIDRTIGTTTFVTTTQATQWLNDGLQRIHYLLANSGDDYFKDSQDIALVAGTTSYNLDSDFYKAKGVDYISGGSTIDVPRYMVKERNALQDATGPGYMYRIHGATIELIPTPGSGTIRVHYVPSFVAIATSTNVHASVPDGWEDYAVLYASTQAILKERLDASEWAARANEQWALMLKFFEPRDQAEPLHVVDIHGRWTRRWEDLDGSY